jgi:hypothetical protein
MKKKYEINIHPLYLNDMKSKEVYFLLIPYHEIVPDSLLLHLRQNSLTRGLTVQNFSFWSFKDIADLDVAVSLMEKEYNFEWDDSRSLE